MINNNGLRDISIYLGNICNFDCTYCDRDYIKNTIGGQHMTPDDIPLIIEFLGKIDAINNPPPMFSFHGGEPFSYVKIMDKILTALVTAIPGEYLIFIQSNGSQMLQNRWFFEKWGSRLSISISYDFLFQDINRTLFGIDHTLDMLKECGVANIQFQYVMPIQDPKVFSLAAIKSITDLCFRHNVKHVNLIPLRHIRGKDKFRVIVDEINLEQFFGAFIKFIHVLYVMGINVLVDGHSDDIDKHYFDDHKQMVLSPDGLIYPEYDFLEYKRTETSIGRWKGDVVLSRKDVSTRVELNPHCSNCPAHNECGLKYLYAVFDRDPTESNCRQFYQMLTFIIKHTQKLKQHPNLVEWIGT